MLDEGTLLHAGAIGNDASDGSVRVEYANDPSAIVDELESAGATVTAEGRKLLVTAPNGTAFDLIRDATVHNDATIRRLDDTGSSLEELFLRHGKSR